MSNIKNLNIWKESSTLKEDKDTFMDMDIAALNLSVRSYNCLKRVGCNTIRDIFNCIGSDGQGLRKIRNLGSRSEREIIDKIGEAKASDLKTQAKENKSVRQTIIKPSKKMWEMEIDQFHLSNYAMQRLAACGIKQVRDLYATNPKNEPGWYAVRELFEKIPSAR